VFKYVLFSCSKIIKSFTNIITSKLYANFKGGFIVSYTGDQLPSKRQFDKDGVLIDPEDTLIDSFLAAMNNYEASNCLRCKHLNDDGLSCAAFPMKIPHEYASGFLRHNRPHKDDNGIMFEAKNPENQSKSYSKI
jgi:hypothetical protein